MPGFLRAGHLPTLVAAFLYFDCAFMVWVMLGPLAIHFGEALELTHAQVGLAVAVPVLSGAILRLAMGVLVDRLSPKRAAIIGQVFVIATLAAAWLGGIRSFGALLVVGVCLGVAGASFAAALPLASRWYPPEHQGTALGITGAGNSGTVLAALLAPGLAAAHGWTNVFGLALLPLGLVFVLFLLLARDVPGARQPMPVKGYIAVLREADLWWLMAFYFISFGGFVGIASSLVLFFNVEYGLPPATAGYFAAACIFAGSLVRPFGGYMADRVGGARSLLWMFGIAAVALAIVSLRLPEAWMTTAVLVGAMFALGMGNGAVFQLVPLRFSRQLGIATGLIGMAGGVGGFLLAFLIGLSKELTDSYRAAFLAFVLSIVVALLGIAHIGRRWRTSWRDTCAVTARI